MSKLRRIVNQVFEKSGFTRNRGGQSIEFIGNLLQCGLVVLCATAAIGCGPHPDGRGDKANTAVDLSSAFSLKTLSRGLPGEPRTLDPQLADDTFSSQVVGDLYEGLTAEDRHGHVVPGVASSWTIDPGGTVYTFELRPDAKWSDGKRIVAAEFVQGLRRAVDPKTASGSSALLAIIRSAREITAGRKDVATLGVTAIGESAVRIEIEHPAPFILQLLAQPIAAPIHLPGEVSPLTASKNIATNGPYILVSRIPNSLIELARNPYYWDFAKVAIAHVRYVNSESEATELREYITGQLDMTFTIPMPDLNRIMQQYGSEVQAAPILGTLYLSLNLSRPQLKNSRDLRQALSMAVDREAIAQYLMMGVSPAYAFVAKGIQGYVSPEYEWSKWSRLRQLTYARSLFERAGYSKKNILRLKLYFNRDEGIQRIMMAVAGSWKQNLGVESELISDEFRVFLVGRKDRNRWDVARLGWSADYDDPANFLDVFAHDNGQNDSGYESDLFNNLIDKARIEPEQVKRALVLQQAEQVLLEDYPMIPIYFYEARRLVKPYLGGAEITPMNRTYSKHLYWKKAS